MVVLLQQGVSLLTQRLAGGVPQVQQCTQRAADT